MKNKYEFKKYLKQALFILIILSVLFLILDRIEYQRYNANFNYKIETIVGEINKKYPEMTDNDIMDIVKKEDRIDSGFLKKYNINAEKDIIVKNNITNHNLFSIVNVLYLILTVCIIILCFIKYNKKKDKEIESIIKSIEEINRKNYKLDLDGMSEDELSILKNEIYKTTIMLKEQAENSTKDRINLKNSLSDISHQLKTPLTSIMIMLDNLIENPDLDVEIRNDFVKEIKVETTNINFLVQSILKLSQLDSNTVEYFNKKIKLCKLVEKSIKKIQPLCDLKNIKVDINIIKDSEIVCDAMWQVEAISNIIKNCVEHSKNNQEVNVSINSNNVYSQIIIKDNGMGISKNDLPHIFERFYKGKNSTSNSIGIGLALAKTIVNKSNGTIQVESEEGKGSIFIIKYFK